MTTQHTPTPWRAIGFTIESHDYDHELVCRVSKSGGGTRIEANAAFIVRACNAHDELVAALESASRWLGAGSPKAARQRIIDALAKVA